MAEWPAGDTVPGVRRVGVIGDVGGHLDALQEALLVLGCEGTSIPEDLVVCQVGDLIHRGPASAEVVAFVDEVMNANPKRWVQLLGNHEENEILRHQFTWPDRVDDTTRDTLAGWWEEGRMQLAWSFDAHGVRDEHTGELLDPGQVLVCHGGMTLGVWEELGAPTSAHTARDLINAQRHNFTHPVWNTGVMIERRIRRDAGVVWAREDDELLWHWRDVRGPGFHQVHGHSSAYNWSRRRYGRGDLEALLLGRTRVDTERRHLRTAFEGGSVWGCDPQHGEFPVRSFMPLVFETP